MQCLWRDSREVGSGPGSLKARTAALVVAPDLNKAADA